MLLIPKPQPAESIGDPRKTEPLYKPLYYEGIQATRRQVIEFLATLATANLARAYLTYEYGNNIYENILIEKVQNEEGEEFNLFFISIKILGTNNKIPNLKIYAKSNYNNRQDYDTLTEQQILYGIEIATDLGVNGHIAVVLSKTQEEHQDYIQRGIPSFWFREGTDQEGVEYTGIRVINPESDVVLVDRTFGRRLQEIQNTY